MKKVATLLTLLTLLLGLSLTGCGDGTPAVANNVKPPVDYQNLAPTTSPTGGNNETGTAAEPLAVLTEQLIADPAKYVGKTVSFGAVVTDFGVGYVLFNKIKAVTDSIPGGAKAEQGAEVTGVCQGLVDGFVVINDSTIIPYCEVS